MRSMSRDISPIPPLPLALRAMCFAREKPRMLRTTRGRRHIRSIATAAGGTMPGVPTISRFFGISIAMFFDDHGPPHFHARHAEGSAKIRIDTLEVIDSNLGRRQLRFALAWAELHQDELI